MRPGSVVPGPPLKAIRTRPLERGVDGLTDATSNVWAEASIASSSTAGGRIRGIEDIALGERDSSRKLREFGTTLGHPTMRDFNFTEVTRFQASSTRKSRRGIRCPQLYNLLKCKAMAEATLSTKNQIVIPREAREAL